MKKWIFLVLGLLVLVGLTVGSANGHETHVVNLTENISFSDVVSYNPYR